MVTTHRINDEAGGRILLNGAAGAYQNILSRPSDFIPQTQYFVSPVIYHNDARDLK
jgi:hypothetical protein